MRTDARAGVALRVLAACVAATSLLAVVSGAAAGSSLHRLLASLALPPLVALVLVAVAAQRRLLAPSLVTLVLFLGAAAFTSRWSHLALAALALASACVACASSMRGTRVARGSVRDYVTLTKPRIMSLLLVTGACGLIVGAHGWPGTSRFALTLLGLALACGGASALNHVLDRDIDRLMGPRTSGRPVASGRLAPSLALEFGLALSAGSFTLLASTVNVLAAVLALVGNAFYVVVYTGYLKRRSPQNIVLGGAAGAVPPLVGYAAATGNLALPALWLALIVFLWTPPHFWALALLLREQYASAKVPMLPVVSGARATVRQIVLYTVMLVAFSIVPFALGAFGMLYLAGALVLGGLFVVLAIRLGRGDDRRRAAVAFHYSLLYLALLFAVAAVDAALPGSAAAASKADPKSFVSWAAGSRALHLTLLAGLGGANNGFNFDGYGRGELLVRVPLGWRVVVDCENRGARRDSCSIVSGALSTTPAFPGATSPNPVLGLLAGRRTTFAFVATRPGTFRIASLVPGHEQARMWDVLDVVRARSPSIAVRPGP
jgi:protoheme IX farnesyltransferase